MARLNACLPMWSEGAPAQGSGWRHAGRHASLFCGQPVFPASQMEALEALRCAFPSFVRTGWDKDCAWLTRMISNSGWAGSAAIRRPSGRALPAPAAWVARLAVPAVILPAPGWDAAAALAGCWEVLVTLPDQALAGWW